MLKAWYSLLFSSSLQWTLWKALFQSGRVVSLPECDWLLHGCHGEVTDDLSPYCAGYSACYAVAAASVWQSALGRGKEKEEILVNNRVGKLFKL